jgi:hypothetical protein
MDYQREPLGPPTATDEWVMKDHTARRREPVAPVPVLSWLFVFAILVLSFIYAWAF